MKVGLPASLSARLSFLTQARHVEHRDMPVWGFIPLSTQKKLCQFTASWRVQGQLWVNKNHKASLNKPLEQFSRKIAVGGGVGGWQSMRVEREEDSYAHIKSVHRKQGYS